MKTTVKVVFAAFAAGLLAMPAWAQDSSPTTRDDAITGYESAAHQSFQGIATDWSSHHVVYSKPAPGSDAENTVQQDPRYWMQQIRRSRQASDPSLADAAVAAQADTATQSDSKKKKHKRKKNTLSGLWSVNLGNNAKVGNEMYPATFTASPTAASCANDFVVYNTSIASPSIVGFNNIYGSSFCSGTVPQVNWAFSTGGTVVTSPVVSLNGQQVAFVQTVSGVANLVVLTWAAGSGSIAAPTALSSNAGYPSCTAPCMISLPLNGNPADTNSSPFVISFGAAQGTLYVGDNAGKLHKFTHIFTSGTPVEDTTSPWPITVHASTVLSSPIADANTNNIFVGDAGGTLKYVRDTGSTTGTCTSGTPPCLGGTTIALGGSVTDGPLLDVSIPKVIWFDSIPGTGGSDLMNLVVQTDEALGTRRTVTFDTGNNSTRTGAMHAGAFDNTYFSTPSSGLLYVCAVDDTGSFFNHPSLYTIGFGAGGLMDTSETSGPLDIATGTSQSANECSPVTEIQTSTTDDFFVSIQKSGGLNHCAGNNTRGCLYSFAISSQTFPGNSTAGLISTGGTSGLSIDNIFSTAGASQVYFTPLDNQTCITPATTGGCAYQASQAGLN